MASIIYIGMDVHTTNYTLCAYMFEGKKAFARTTIDPNIDDLLKYLANLQQRYPGCELECGYEAGCLGYSLYHQLTRNKYKCVILAPTTMPSTAKEIKTDRRDALKIAQCMEHTVRSTFPRTKTTPSKSTSGCGMTPRHF